MKRRFLPFVLTVLASMSAVTMAVAAPKLCYNGDTLQWNTDWERTLVDYLNPEAVIAEVSGIACSRVTPGYLWMQSDEIQDYLVATDETGQKRYAKVQFPGEKYLWDWEDLCGGVYNGKNYLFIGAFGNNNEERTEYCIVWFEEPEITSGQINITPSRINYQYPEGKKHNAEAIMYDNKEQMIYIITKVYYDVCQVFKLPFRTDYGDTKQTLTYVCDLGKKSDLGEGSKPDKGFHLVTAADISPDGKYVLIKNQNNTNAQYSWILLWERKGDESISETLKRQPQPLKCYEVEWQGEAICWKDNYTFFTTSDSDAEERPPLYKYTRKEPGTKKEIVIDGKFDDWSDLKGLARATADADDNALCDLRVYADTMALYFYMEYKPTAVQMSVFFNTDEDPKTGYNAWMWNGTAEYLFTGTLMDKLEDSGLNAFDGADQDAWKWKAVEIENLFEASSVVELENKHKAIEVSINLKKMPELPLKMGIFSSDANWTENGFLPKEGSPMLDIEIYKEPEEPVDPEPGDQAIDQVGEETKAKSQKILRNGQIIILRGNKTYNIMGQNI